MKTKCIRCESLERSQMSKSIYSIKNELGEFIPLCAVCVVEIKEEEEFFKNLEEVDYGPSEEFD